MSIESLKVKIEAELRRSANERSEPDLTCCEEKREKLGLEAKNEFKERQANLELKERQANFEAELEKRVVATKHSERIRTALTGIQSAIVLVDSVDQGLDVVNAYAAEHLEIQTRNAAKDSEKIRNAGAVFIGRFSPVSLGDYSAGSNHVLPTGGCACHSSGLSVQTFLRGLHFIEYDKKAFSDILDTVVTLANSEDLPAHGEAMTARLENQ
jgi:histidinol dehydrogenase